VCACVCKQTFIARAIVSRHTCHLRKKSIKKTIASQNLRHAREREKSERESEEEEEEDKRREKTYFLEKVLLLRRVRFTFSRELLKQYNKFS
jgi:hypothetical protein